MILPLNPPLLVEDEDGDKGRALFVIDDGHSDNLIWIVALKDSGRIFSYDTCEITLLKNSLDQYSHNDWKTISGVPNCS